ncbi:MAG: hypothetical protein APF78_05405 [Sphingomonadales bacterium BRH_c3]|nr:MAG: hypothetical protein APF78_05405 [Sphingomonadales bacterium BRH_c3]
MEVIDCQVHIIDRNRPERPWVPGFAESLAGTLAGEIFTTGSAIITDEEMVAAMDRAGVDGALLVPTSHYGWDNSYSVEAARKWPERFRVVGRVEPFADDVEARMQAWAAEPMAVGIRLLLKTEAEADGSSYDRILASAAENLMPVCVHCSGILPAMERMARRHPTVQLVIDHVGMHQPPMHDPGPQPLHDLPQLLAMASLPNVAVKLSGLPSLSLEPFPFRDLEKPLRQIIDAFGVERLMWGTDWTRVVHLYSYRDTVRFITESPELDEVEKQALLGGSLRRIFGWPAS